MSYQRLSLLDRNDIYYQGAILIPLGTVRWSRQFATYIGCLCNQMFGQIPGKEYALLREIQGRIFSVIATMNTAATYAVLGKNSMVYIPNGYCRRVNEDGILVPIGSRERLEQLEDILDHILWANTKKHGHEFYKMLEDLSLRIHAIKKCLDGSGDKVPFWVGKAA